MYNTLLTALEEQILTITINRPDKLNALNKTVLDELSEVLDDINKNDSIRSVIITGAGTKAFIAGADISEFMQYSSEEGIELAKKGQHIFSRIENSRKPIIAAVNGFALGGGCELAMSCHFRIASENARFGQPEVNLGLIPGYGGTQRLPQLIGKGRALEMMMTAQMVDAADAKAMGLVNHVTAPDQLLLKTREVLSMINAKSPTAVSLVIGAVNSGLNNHNGYDVEAQLFGDCFGTAEMKEGVSAFLEKRKPDFG